MFGVLRTVLVVAGVGLALAACQSTPPVPTLPEISFAHLSRMGLAVERVEVVAAYRPPLRAPNVEHEFPTPPHQAMARWAADRLFATGSDTGLVAKYTILDASVTETQLKTEKGIKGIFTTDQAERYRGKVAAKLEIFNARGQRLAGASAKAERMRTIDEDASLNDRDRIWLEFTEKLVGDLDAALEPAIRTHLHDYLR